MEHICYNCFQSTLDVQNICTRCGFDGQRNREKFPQALPLGSILFGRYIVGRVLGQGGFGITYLAQDNQTKGLVAIKEFFPDSMATRTERTIVTPYPGERGENFAYGRTKFLEEAQAMAEFIGNPNITRIDSYFEENGTGYFVMEYLEGQSFLDYIQSRGGVLRWEETMQVIFPVMNALAAMHEKGMIHRDVTPDNIYITRDGVVKLLDFGAARYSLGNVSRSLDVILKHGFAPYEQYSRRGKQGPFTDVYSLGATIYHALTGMKPDDAIERRDEDNTPLPTSLGARITDDQEEVVMRALAVMPVNRYQNIPQFRSALLAAQPKPVPEPEPPRPEPPKPEPPKPEPTPKKSLPKWLIVAAAALIIVAGGIRIWTTVIQPARDYEAAQSLLDAGEYAQAEEAFEALGTYRNSYEKLTELRGNVNCTYEENGECLTITGCRGTLPKEVILPRVIDNRIVTKIGEYAFSESGFTSVSIPDSVTSIGESAFRGCTSLTTISIPSSVTSIGSYAFSGCISLSNVSIPVSITSIENNAFFGCKALSSVSIPNSVTSIGDFAFSGCISLSTISIPVSVTSIENYAFFDCKGLSSVSIPNSVTSIGSHAFSGCTGLSTVSIPNSITSIDDYAFYRCKGLVSVLIPNSVTSIGNGAFSQCISLSTVSIPNSVTSIGEHSFSGCTSLTSVSISNHVTSIKASTFSDCTSLTSISIPNHVTSIGESAFRGCSSLKYIAIPDSVTSIGWLAFSGCSSLSFISIPDSVKSVGAYAFMGCTILKRVSIPRNCNYYTGSNSPSFPSGCTVTRR